MSARALPIARRNQEIEPFYVMEVVKEADRMAAQGRSIIHLSIGEPDFTAPEAVRAAARQAIDAGLTQYTPALGIAELRRAIADDYHERFGVTIAPARIVVTAGASAALLLALAAVLERDHELLLPDPCYPCNRHFAAVLDGRARLLPCGPETRFQPTAELIEASWSAQTGGVLLASPSNPTGTSVDSAELRRIAELVRARGGFVIVDEIYNGLCYEGRASTVLSSDDDVLVLNSFSKYFSMTGWRLGWLVTPAMLAPTIEKLAQNLFICASAVAQHAALGCYRPESMAEFERRRAEFHARRDLMVPALQQLGFRIPALPDGAFYIYADISALARDSWTFAFDLLHATGVCLVPGRDFGRADVDRYVRISYANERSRLQQAIERMAAYLR